MTSSNSKLLYALAQLETEVLASIQIELMAKIKNLSNPKLVAHLVQLERDALKERMLHGTNKKEAELLQTRAELTRRGLSINRENT